MLSLLLTLKLLPLPVVPEKLELKCTQVSEEQGRVLLVRSPDWDTSEHPRLELCGKVALPGRRWGVLVREVGSGMILDHDMVFLVAVSAEGTRLDELAFSGREDREGGSGSHRRTGAITADGRVELRIARTLPEAETELQTWELAPAGKWARRGKRLDGEQPQVQETCLAYDDRYEMAPLMRIRTGIPAGRVSFQKKAEACAGDSKACPSRQKAYVIPGDVVFVGPELRGFRCAYYGTAKGDILAGFLPKDALEEVPDDGDLDAAFLSGTWASLGDNPITFTAADAMAVHAEGKAIWRGGSGVAHEGAFSATAEPRGASMIFEEHGSGCEVKVRRRGPYLVVSDNTRCGGVNVRFQGIYVRRTR